MILQSLAGYYQRLGEEGENDVAAEGFEKKEIPFLILLDKAGKFVGIRDTRDGEGKKKRGRIFTVPKGVKKSSGVVSNLLWDNPGYVFGIPKSEKEKDVSRALEQQSCFIEKIQETFPRLLSEGAIKAVLAFLNAEDRSTLHAHGLWSEMGESGANVTFKIEGDDDLVCQRPEVVEVLTSSSGEIASGELQACLISGEKDEPVRLHTAIKGVWGAQSSGANIVSFNLDAFRSYGKKQGQNSPVGKKAEFAYTTALNILLEKNSGRRIQIGDASTVFWAEKKNDFEDVFGSLFGEPSKENPEQTNAAFRALYQAPFQGALPLEGDTTRFYVLGLAPNAARIAIRFWQVATVGELAKNIKLHFDDCAIVHGSKKPEHLSLFRMLVSTALQGKSENIQPNLSGDFMSAILKGTPYPGILLSSAIRRCRAEREITYPRAALIKAVLVRNARFYNQNEKEVAMSLDRDNPNIGYRLGRLFAVLEKTQEEANPGLNATIKDRFYGSASSVPSTVFPHLMKLKNHHISKMESKGRSVNLEKMLGEIVDGISDFPTRLSLQDQGRFAIGYYHERQEFFTKKPKKEDEA